MASHDHDEFPNRSTEATDLNVVEYNAYDDEDENNTICCSYCGVRSPSSIVQCNTCKKWFCNGKGSCSGSHIVMHMVRTKHKEINLHPKSPLGDSKLECYNCGNSNCFVLGFISAQEESAVVLLCREPCASVAKDPSWDLTQWTPLIQERAFVSWLIPVPTQEEALCRRVTSAMIARMENTWHKQMIDMQHDSKNSSSSSSGSSSQQMALYSEMNFQPEIAVQPVPLRFSDPNKYQEIFAPLIQLEAEEDRRTKESQSKSGISIKWDVGLKKQRLAYFLFPKEESEFKLMPGDELILSHDAEGKTPEFKAIGHVVNMTTNEEVCLELKPGVKVNTSITTNYTVQFVWKSTSFDRMTAALRTFSDQPLCMSAYLRGLILGDRLLAITSAQIFSPPVPTPQTITTAPSLGSGMATSSSSSQSTESTSPFSSPEEHQYAMKKAYEQATGFPFPTMPARFSAPNLPDLNHSQVSAVKNVLCRPLSIIQGPPGTGKTVTSATIVYNMVKMRKGQVLVCAPSNVAVDQLTEKIARTKVKVVRMVAKSRESIVSPVEKYTLHWQVEKLKTPDAVELHKLQALRNEIGELSPEDSQRFHQLRRKVEKEILTNADVICCTTAGAGDPRLLPHVFQLVLIDESTQATEPETLIPLVKGAKQVVFIGDHCQLGPVIMCKRAMRNGLSQSMFERLVLLGIRPMRLQVQYRMHPCLSEFPSAMFYEGSLQNGVTASDRSMKRVMNSQNAKKGTSSSSSANQSESIESSSGSSSSSSSASTESFPWPMADHPMMFLASTALEEISSSGTSYLNRTEADNAAAVVGRLLQCGVSASSIGIITPYEGQCAYIPSVLQRTPLTSGIWEQIEVASVDAFQGREKDFIILSCVRSNQKQGIGFLSDPRRMNVSLTRARFGLICLGNPRVLAKDALWNNLLVHFQEHRSLVEGPLTKLRDAHIRFSTPRKVVQSARYIPQEALNEFKALGAKVGNQRLPNQFTTPVGTSNTNDASQDQNSSQAKGKQSAGLRDGTGIDSLGNPAATAMSLLTPWMTPHLSHPQPSAFIYTPSANTSSSNSSETAGAKATETVNEANTQTASTEGTTTNNTNEIPPAENAALPDANNVDSAQSQDPNRAPEESTAVSAPPRKKGKKKKKKKRAVEAAPAPSPDGIPQFPSQDLSGLGLTSSPRTAFGEPLVPMPGTDPNHLVDLSLSLPGSGLDGMVPSDIGSQQSTGYSVDPNFGFPDSRYSDNYNQLGFGGSNLSTYSDLLSMGNTPSHPSGPVDPASSLSINSPAPSIQNDYFSIPGLPSYGSDTGSFNGLHAGPMDGLDVDLSNIGPNMTHHTGSESAPTQPTYPF